MNMNFLDRLVAWDYQALSFFNSLVGKSSGFDFLLKFLAVGLIYVIPILLVIGYFWSSQAKRVMIMAALAGLFAWRIVGKLVSVIYFRERPFTNIKIDLKEIIFHRPTYSFPSDHALFLAAIFMVFWLYGYRKLAVFAGVIGITVSLMRITVGLHYPLDIVSGVILGLLAGCTFFWQREFLERYIAKPIETMIYKVIKH